MKAIRVEQFGGPEVMKLQDVPDPRADQGQLVVRVKAIGVNPVDAYIRSGTYARKPSLPYTPGADGAGIVESVGGNVRRFEPGDRVYMVGSITGTYAELSICPESRVFPLPAKISFAQGAAMGLPNKFKAIADGANEFNVPKALGKRMVPNFWTAEYQPATAASSASITYLR